MFYFIAYRFQNIVFFFSEVCFKTFILEGKIQFFKLLWKLLSEIEKKKEILKCKGFNPAVAWSL